MNENHTKNLVKTNKNNPILQSVQCSHVLPNCINAITKMFLASTSAIVILGLASKNTTDAVPMLDNFCKIVNSASEKR
jgi:hypothetical protein